MSSFQSILSFWAANVEKSNEQKLAPLPQRSNTKKSNISSQTWTLGIPREHLMSKRCIRLSIELHIMLYHDLEILDSTTNAMYSIFHRELDRKDELPIFKQCIDEIKYDLNKGFSFDDLSNEQYQKAFHRINKLNIFERFVVQYILTLDENQRKN